MSDDTRHNVSRSDAEQAVRTLLRWSGENPEREGLLDTPKRAVKAYEDWFSGYAMDPDDYLARTFEEVCGYDEMIVLRDIQFESHCEHHMAPIIGRAHVGYLPNGKVVLAGTPYLAGAGHLLDTCAANALRFTEIGPAGLERAAATVPARILGLAGRKGRVAPGFGMIPSRSRNSIWYRTVSSSVGSGREPSARARARR